MPNLRDSRCRWPEHDAAATLFENVDAGLWIDRGGELQGIHEDGFEVPHGLDTGAKLRVQRRPADRRGFG